MDIQTILNNAVSAKRAEVMKTSEQLTLGELILKIEACSPKRENGDDKSVRFNFERLRPTGLDSWRGIYAELALEFGDEGGYTVTEFLSLLKGAVGKTFEGYKGGDFTMDKSTPIWVANNGNSGDTGVVGVREDHWEVILITDQCES